MALKNKQNRTIVLNFPELLYNSFMESQEIAHQTIQMRKIKVAGITYQIRPSFVLPYCKAKTQEASGGLFLLKFGVPFWALAYVFGKNTMWWYRLYLSFSSYSIVGTTVKDATFLPTDLLADEHHIHVKGEKSFVATTCGAN